MSFSAAPEFLVNSRTASTQAEAEITALANGRFVITWTDFSQGFGGPGDAPIGTGVDLRAQVHEADGTRVGTEIRSTPPSTASRRPPGSRRWRTAASSWSSTTPAGSPTVAAAP
jgi:hypothetical protein